MCGTQNTALPGVGAGVHRYGGSRERMKELKRILGKEDGGRQGRELKRERDREIYSGMQKKFKKKTSLKPVKLRSGCRGQTGDKGLGPLLRDGIPSVDRHR